MVPVRGMKKTSLWKSRPWPSRRAYVKLHSSSPFHPLLPPFFFHPLLGEIIRRSRGTIPVRRGFKVVFSVSARAHGKSVSKQLRISMEMSGHDSIDYLFIAPWPLQRTINSIGQKSAAERSPSFFFFALKSDEISKLNFPFLSLRMILNCCIVDWFDGMKNF